MGLLCYRNRKPENPFNRKGLRERKEELLSIAGEGPAIDNLLSPPGIYWAGGRSYLDQSRRLQD